MIIWHFIDPAPSEFHVLFEWPPISTCVIIVRKEKIACRSFFFIPCRSSIWFHLISKTSFYHWHFRFWDNWTSSSFFIPKVVGCDLKRNIFWKNVEKTFSSLFAFTHLGNNMVSIHTQGCASDVPHWPGINFTNMIW